MNPKVVQQVNKELDSYVGWSSKGYKKLNKPWETSKLGRKAHPPKVVALCNILRILTNRT